jgi:hypothetical protein
VFIEHLRGDAFVQAMRLRLTANAEHRSCEFIPRSLRCCAEFAALP